MHLIDEGVTKHLASLTVNVPATSEVARGRRDINKKKKAARLDLEDMRKNFETVCTPREVTAIT